MGLARVRRRALLDGVHRAEKRAHESAPCHPADERHEPCPRAPGGKALPLSIVLVALDCGHCSGGPRLWPHPRGVYNGRPLRSVSFDLLVCLACFCLEATEVNAVLYVNVCIARVRPVVRPWCGLRWYSRLVL